MSKSAAERQADARAKRKKLEAERADVGPLMLFVEYLQKENEWLRNRDVTLRHELSLVTSRVTELVEKLAGIASGLGGAGGVSSPISSLSLFPEKSEESREFQDLNGRTRPRGSLQNGTLVPGSFGDVTGSHNGVTDRHVVTSRTVTEAAVFDSEKAETELRRKPLKDADMVAKARAEAERLQAEFGVAK